MAADEVAALPGWDDERPLPSRHYSGLVPLKTSLWHYHLTEAEAPHDPATAPLLLFLAGGPGDSSFSSSFRGFGQLLLDERSLDDAAAEDDAPPRLIHHDFGWTRVANVLTLDSPPGVGYSLSKDGTGGWTDATVAADTAEVLRVLASQLHPAYRGRRFFIVGESYAGISVAMLAEEILRQQAAACQQ